MAEVITLVLAQVRGPDGRPVYGHTGPRYEVLLDGEVLVKSARDADHVAARVLQARGLTGPFRTTDGTGKVRMTYPSIEAAAKWTIQEHEDGDPTFRRVRWQPHPLSGRDEDDGSAAEGPAEVRGASQAGRERVGGSRVAPGGSAVSLERVG